MAVPDQTEYILQVLPRLLQNILGVADDEALSSPDDDLIAWFREHMDDDLPLYCLTADIGACCGTDGKVICDFLGSRAREAVTRGQKLSLGEFAAWLAERSRCPSFEPVNVAGVDCGPAGAFFGLRDLAAGMKEKVSPFAPSTPILRRLNGASLQSYWFLLQAHQPDGLPELAWPWEAVADHMLWKGLLGCVVGLIGWFVLQSPLAAIELLTAYFCMSMWEKLRLSGNPLPQNIVTFGDLARLIAQQRPARA